MNPANLEKYVAPYVEVRHAIHLLYATSPRNRDGQPEPDAGRRLDKFGNRLTQDIHGCGCSLCANQLGSPRPGRGVR